MYRKSTYQKVAPGLNDSNTPLANNKRDNTWCFRRTVCKSFIAVNIMYNSRPMGWAVQIKRHSSIAAYGKPALFHALSFQLQLCLPIILSSIDSVLNPHKIS